ncbi:MAG TPA: hypothetical protein VFC13_12270, partial [Actinomycetes bacterium]|nr:hypothetical protein [Actinomycetes bacterium]
TPRASPTWRSPTHRPDIHAMAAALVGGHLPNMEQPAAFNRAVLEFLEQAAGPLHRRGLARLAGDYRELAAAWTALAQAAMAAGGDGPLARAAALLERRRRLVEDQGAAAAGDLAAVQAELGALAAGSAVAQPLDPGALSSLLADLRRRVLDLAEAEEAAAAALREEQP